MVVTSLAQATLYSNIILHAEAAEKHRERGGLSQWLSGFSVVLCDSYFINEECSKAIEDVESDDENY